MVYDEATDMEYDDWFGLVEDFGFEPGREISHDVYTNPDNVLPAAMRVLVHRLEAEVDGFWDEDLYLSRHIIAIGQRANSAEDAYHKGKGRYPDAKLVAKLKVGPYIFYVGAVPKSA